MVYNSSKRKQGSDYVSARAGSEFGYQEGEETLKLLLFVNGCHHHYQSKACIAYGLSIANQDRHKKYIANISNNTINTNVNKIINKILMPCEAWFIAHMQAKIQLHCLTQVKCHVSKDKGIGRWVCLGFVCVDCFSSRPYFIHLQSSVSLSTKQVKWLFQSGRAFVVVTASYV